MNREISKYFRLEQRIQRLKNRIIDSRANLYCQSFTPRVSVEDGRLRFVSFKMEEEVCKHADDTIQLEQSIKELETRQRHFISFLKKLSLRDINYLHKKYMLNMKVKPNETLESKVSDEIEQIETAVCYMYGYPVKEETLDDINDHVLKFAELLGV